MLGLTVTHSPSSLLIRSSVARPRKNPNPNTSFSNHTKTLLLPPKPSPLSKSASDQSEFVPPSSLQDGLDDDESELESDPDLISIDDGFEIEVKKVGKKNRRRIQSRIRVDADLETVWSVLTDYEGLADFIPSLAVSQLLEKKDNFARLYQVGQQELALGLKFDAKGVIDCYEGDLEHLPSGRRRGIEFKMVEGDFQTFEGRWSIEQLGVDKDICNFESSGLKPPYLKNEKKKGLLNLHTDNETYNVENFLVGEFQTTLSYVVELEPKLWLPVRLLEGRLCREVKMNLLCVREEAQRVQRVGGNTLPTWSHQGSVFH